MKGKDMRRSGDVGRRGRCGNEMELEEQVAGLDEVIALRSRWGGLALAAPG